MERSLSVFPKCLPKVPIPFLGSSRKDCFMFKRMWMGCLVVLAGLAPMARADEPTQPLIVLVGIDKYNDAQIKPRKHGEADAKALYDLFTSKDYLGIDAKHIKLLLGT